MSAIRDLLARSTGESAAAGRRFVRVPACRQAGLASAAGTHGWVVIGRERLVPVGIEAEACLAEVLGGRRLLAAALAVISRLPGASGRCAAGTSPTPLDNRGSLAHAEPMLTWHNLYDKRPDGPSISG
jgi:hypothetical protein